jgi:mycothiol synthase
VSSEAPSAPVTRLEVLGRLDPSEVAAVALLVERATEVDGVRPLSEHVVLHLRYGGDAPAVNILAYRSTILVGYAHLDTTDEVAGASAELVVEPAHRGAGVGRQLVEAALAGTPDGRLRLWTHGGHVAAAALAASMGFTKIRELWQMRRPLRGELPAPNWPPGVAVRTFVPGRDEDAWLALNARAFADHPEQGALDRADLDRRMREPWFDPAGFFLAYRAGDPTDSTGAERLVGFHWTKVHGGGAGEHGHDPIGEVYVVGVDPDAQGGGLGRALTLIGLAHLRQRGLPQVLLYVDADNAAAIGVYRGLGFTRWDTDVMYGHG